MFLVGLLSTFATLLVPGKFIGIKREYGVNPELSRSCKLYNGIQIKATFLTDWEGRITGSKSEDLP